MFKIKLGGFVAGFIGTSAAYYRLFAVPMIDVHNAHMAQLDEVEEKLGAAHEAALRKGMPLIHKSGRMAGAAAPSEATEQQQQANETAADASGGDVPNAAVATA